MQLEGPMFCAMPQITDIITGLFKETQRKSINLFNYNLKLNSWVFTVHIGICVEIKFKTAT